MEFNRRNFLKLIGLTFGALGTGAYLSTRDRATVANKETSKPFFPEELQQTLEGWVADQNYDYPTYDHEAIKPLETYAKELYATSPSGGWRKVEGSPSAEVWVGESSSPELLQDSKAVFFKINDEWRGFLWNDFATLSLQGKSGQTGWHRSVEGTLTQFSGGEIENYKGTMEARIPMPSDTPIPFLFVLVSPDGWQGLIWFRTHERPLGFGEDKDSLPKPLKWKGDWVPKSSRVEG